MRLLICAKALKELGFARIHTVWHHFDVILYVLTLFVSQRICDDAKRSEEKATESSKIFGSEWDQEAPHVALVSGAACRRAFGAGWVMAAVPSAVLEAFKLFDKDGNGTISREELGEAQTQLQKPPFWNATRNSRCEFFLLYMIGVIRFFFSHKFFWVKLFESISRRSEPLESSKVLCRSWPIGISNQIIHSNDFRIQKHDKRLAPNLHRKLWPVTTTIITRL